MVTQHPDMSIYIERRKAAAQWQLHFEVLTSADKYQLANPGCRVHLQHPPTRKRVLTSRSVSSSSSVPRSNARPPPSRQYDHNGVQDRPSQRNNRHQHDREPRRGRRGPSPPSQRSGQSRGRNRDRHDRRHEYHE